MKKVNFIPILKEINHKTPHVLLLLFTDVGVADNMKLLNTNSFSTHNIQPNASIFHPFLPLFQVPFCVETFLVYPQTPL